MAEINIPGTVGTARRQSMRELIRSDITRYATAEGNAITRKLALRMIFLVPGFQFVLSRRIQDALYRLPVVGRAFGRVWWWWTCRSFGSELGIGAKVGSALYIPHAVGIVIGFCTIGDGVTILQNVTIGKKSGVVGGAPLICDGAYLSAGAVVLGDIRIGINATVGANSVVTADVPDGCVAVGAPARIVRRPTNEQMPTPATTRMATNSPGEIA